MRTDASVWRVEEDMSASHSPPYEEESEHHAAFYNETGMSASRYAVEVDSMRQSVSTLSERVRVLESFKQDLDRRLERQEEVVDQQELKAKVDNDKWQDRLKGYEDKIGEMALHIRTRDKRILAVENKYRRTQMEMQDFHKNKHEIAAKAKKVEREDFMHELRFARTLRKGSIDETKGPK